MNELKDRLTRNLLDLIESNNYYWDIIRKRNETISSQDFQIKQIFKDNRKLVKKINTLLNEKIRLENEIQTLKSRLNITIN
jgi:capsid portal protein